MLIMRKRDNINFCFFSFLPVFHLKILNFAISLSNMWVVIGGEAGQFWPGQTLCWRRRRRWADGAGWRSEQFKRNNVVDWTPGFNVTLSPSPIDKNESLEVGSHNVSIGEDSAGNKLESPGGNKLKVCYAKSNFCFSTTPIRGLEVYGLFFMLFNKVCLDFTPRNWLPLF